MYYCIILTILTTGNPVRPFCGMMESLFIIIIIIIIIAIVSTLYVFDHSQVDSIFQGHYRTLDSVSASSRVLTFPFVMESSPLVIERCANRE